MISEQNSLTKSPKKFGSSQKHPVNKIKTRQASLKYDEAAENQQDENDLMPPRVDMVLNKRNQKVLMKSNQKDRDIITTNQSHLYSRQSVNHQNDEIWRKNSVLESHKQQILQGNQNRH